MPELDTQTDTPTEEENKNIWQELLQASSQQGRWEIEKEASATCIVLGDKNNGKSSVLNRLSNRITNVGSPEYILDYSYMNVKNKYNLADDEILSRMSVWQLDDHNHKDLLVNLVPPQSLSSACYMITCDLSQPWDLISSLTKWLGVAKDINENLMAKLSEAEVTKLKTSVSKFSQLFVDPSSKIEDPSYETAAAAVADTPTEEKAGEEKRDERDELKVSTEITEEESKELSIDLSKPEINLGVPILIVCNKADYFNRVLAKQGADEKFDLVAYQLRKLAVKYDATLVFTSAFGEGVNIDLCQNYLYHRLFNFPLKHSAKVIGSAEDVGLYVPAGYDSDDLIASGTKLKNGWDGVTKLETVFENVSAGKKADKAAMSVVTAASNEDFFKGLKDQLEKGHPSTPSTSSSVTSGKEEGKDEKRNQKVVKSFFKSLLSGPTSGGGVKREEARAAMNDLKTES